MDFEEAAFLQNTRTMITAQMALLGTWELIVQVNISLSAWVLLF